MAQNSLELKPSSRSSQPFYAKQRTVSAGKKKKKKDIKADYAQLPAGPASGPAPSGSSLWLISKIPCPSRLRDNYSEQPWRTGLLKTDFHIYAYIYLLFSWVRAAAH